MLLASSSRSAKRWYWLEDGEVEIGGGDDVEDDRRVSGGKKDAVVGCVVRRRRIDTKSSCGERLRCCMAREGARVGRVLGMLVLDTSLCSCSCSRNNGGSDCLRLLLQWKCLVTCIAWMAL